MKATARALRWIGRLLVRLARIALLLLLVFILGGVVAWGWFDRTILSTLPSDLSQYRQWRPPTSCRVFASDGSQVDEFYVERRIWVPLGELRDTTWHAFIAAEDRRFLTHHGVDWRGVARAMRSNLQGGAVRQGGSTITQQLVKNLIVGNEKSYRRKLKEAALAMRLEREMSKQEILELYMNYVFLGSGNYGVEAAARDYFGVSARELDPGQAALLASLVPAPSRYSPRKSPELAAQRRDMVLGAMVEVGALDVGTAAQFLGTPVVVDQRGGAGGVAVAYRTQVRREVRTLFPGNLPFEAGLQVHTPLDLHIQGVAEEAVRKALLAHLDRQGRLSGVEVLPEDQWEVFVRQGRGFVRDAESGTLVPPEEGQCFDVIVGPSRDLGDLRAGPWRFALEAEERRKGVRVAGSEVRRVALEGAVQPGEVLGVCLESVSSGSRPQETAFGTVRLDARPWAEGAAVVIENATGHVVALVGGYKDGLEGFVRATQARRQPGSSFKPYVYAAALLGGRRQTDEVLDAPIALNAGGGRIWRPQNYTPEYAGLLPMRSALARSLNTVAVRLTLDAGPAEVARIARAMGVDTPLRVDPTIGLGSSEVTPMDQALGYATIARMGLPAVPVWIDRLDDAQGREVGRAGQSAVIGDRPPVILPGRPGPRALPAGIAYELCDMMREVVRAGTARKAKKPGFDRAGKTGTTNGFVDAWFVGMTPRWTIAVWVGTDGTASLGEKETGGKTALPAWIEIVDALEQPEGERFPVPDEAVLVPVADPDIGWMGFGRGRVPPGLLDLDDPDGAPLPAFQEVAKGR